MITHSDKQIKKQLPSLFHLHLHGAAALKRRPTANDEGQIMRTQLRLGVGCIRVGISRTSQDRAALDAGVEALFAQGEPLKNL
jgi:hypothetical protein